MVFWIPVSIHCTKVGLAACSAHLDTNALCLPLSTFLLFLHVLSLLFCAEFRDAFLFGATLSGTLFVLSLSPLLFRGTLEELLVKIFASSLEFADCLLDESGVENYVEVAISPLAGK
jgi:hypothetical protein